jgi:hypothetical protein
MKHNTILIIVSLMSIALGIFDLSLMVFRHVAFNKVSMGAILFPWGIAMLWFALSTRKHFR